MNSTIKQALCIGLLSCLVASCADKASSPTAPSQLSVVSQPDASALVVFREPTGFSTSDLYDARDRIVQLTNAGDLVVTHDGAHVPGFEVTDDSRHWGPPTYFIGFRSGRCSDFCVFSVRFGTRDGQRRAYLTIDYGHSNPGTLVDVDVTGGALVVTQTSLFPPGTPTLSGAVTEMTQAGAAPVAGAWVSRSVPAGWQAAMTDQDGLYTISGLIDGTDEVVVDAPGYQQELRQLALVGDTRFDIQLVRR